MKSEWQRADRAAAVRSAGAAWHRVGLIDDSAFAALKARFPDDRARVGPVFGVLLFVFTFIAIAAVLGFFVVVFKSGNATEKVLSVCGFICGLFAALATEWQLGKLRRRQGGTESATSLVAVGLVLCPLAYWIFDPSNGNLRSSVLALSLCCLVVTALASWRWGYPAYAGCAAMAGFVAVAQLPYPRVSWIVLPLVLMPLLLRASRSARLPPAHRHSALVAALVSFAALYVAFHIGSWDLQAIEALGNHHTPGPPHGDAAWWASIAATALLPLVVIAGSVVRRRVPTLVAGVVAAAASIATYRVYVDNGPFWVFLAAVGAGVFLLALALWRFLERGSNGERHGFSAAPLLTDLRRQGWIESAAAAAIPAGSHAEPGQPGFEGGGGRSGGAGASAGF